MTSNLFAIVAALGAAFFLALAAALQQRGAASVSSRGTMHPGLILVDLVRQPGWLAGILLGLVGVGLQVTALRWGPLALVQPVGVTTLLFALPVGAGLRGKRVARSEMYAAAVVAVGLGGLLVTLDPAPGTPALDLGHLTMLALGSAVGVAGCVLGARYFRAAGRTLLLAAGTGVAFGTTAALVQVLVHRAAEQGISVFTSWLTLATAAFSIAGFVLSQGAYRSGRLSTALAAILVIDPLAAIGVGAFALGQPVSATRPLLAVVETLLIVGGVAVLARFAQHPYDGAVAGTAGGERSSRTPSFPGSPVSPGRSFVDSAVRAGGPPEGAAARVTPQAVPRVLIGADTYPPDVNGAAHFTERLAYGLAARGREVHVVAPSTSLEAYTETRDGVTVHRVPSRCTPFHPSFRVCLRSRAGVSRILGLVAPDVVHVQSHFLIGRALIALARRGGVPVVATNHFMPENLLPYTSVPAWTEPVLTAFAWHDVNRVFQRAYAVTTPTPIAAALLRAKGFPRPVTPISCGIDLQRFSAYEGRRSPDLFRLPERPTLLFVGRLDVEKRIGDLVDALQVVRSRVDAQLAIAGVGTRRAELEQRALARGVGEHVHFLGHVPEEVLPLVYTVADVFCMPGVAELQSLVTLEAMASARPVVAADAMALPHLVHNGRNGFRYEPGNTRILAGHLVSLLNDPALRREMGRASAAVAAQHDVARSLDLFEKLYEDAAGHASRNLPQPVMSTA